MSTFPADSTALKQSLRSLFVQHRWKISATYVLTSLENLFNLLYPFATGLAINDLLNNSYHGLSIFLCTWIVHLMLGVLRQRFDTRVFTSIYGVLASNMVLTQFKAGVPSSQVVARATLSREIVDFFERDVPLIISSIFSFVGSLVMLFLYDAPIGAACLFLVLPLSLLSRSYAAKTMMLNKSWNDQREREVEIIESRDEQAIKEHYNLLAQWQVKLSDAEATNWGLLEAAMIGLAATVIIRAVSLDSVAPGTIYAIISYLWNFVASLATVPFLVQQLARLKDISQRVVGQEPT